MPAPHRAEPVRSHRPAPSLEAAFAPLLPQVPDVLSRLGEVPPLAGGAPAARKVTPRAVPVTGLRRDVSVKIASERAEWKDAFQLVASNYQACGYEAPHASKVRFTPYHALPDTVTFIATHEGRILMTMTLVPDNTLLGLPLEAIFGEEIRALRRQRRRMGEVISLAADKDVSMREFRQVFVALIRLMKQYHVTHGGDTWVITVNPKHRDFYTKALGYVPLGPSRDYEAVQGAPAEAYMLDVSLMKAGAPKLYQQIFGEWLPGEALVAPKMLAHMVRFLGAQSSKDAHQTIREVFNLDQYFSSPRRW